MEQRTAAHAKPRAKFYTHPNRHGQGRTCDQIGSALSVYNFIAKEYLHLVEKKGFSSTQTRSLTALTNFGVGPQR